MGDQAPRRSGQPGSIEPVLKIWSTIDLIDRIRRIELIARTPRPRVARCKERHSAVEGSAAPIDGTDATAGPPAGNTVVNNDESRLPGRIYRLTRRLDNASLRFLDAAVILVSWSLAFLAGFEGSMPSDLPGGPVLYLALPLTAQLVANQLAGLYGPIWKYASVEEAARVVIAVACGAVASTIGLAVLDQFSDATLPVFTTPPVAALFVLLGCGGIRFQARLFALERQRVGKTDTRLRTLIVGSGSSGAALARELMSGDHADSRVIGFIDDNPELRGRSVRSVRVLGTTDDLEQVCERHSIDRVLVALPNARREETQAIVARALTTDAQVKVLPRASELIGGPLLHSLRDLDLTDLLGREHAPVDTDEIADYLEGATVLVTGAGGSIGSEIARQVARYRPGRLLLLDRDESLLHETVTDDLAGAGAEPVLADIRDRPRVCARSSSGTARRRLPRRRAQARPDPRAHPVEAAHTNLLGHLVAGTDRRRVRLWPLRAHLHRQGREPVLGDGGDQARGRARRASRSAANTSSRTRRCASATFSAVVAASSRRSCARSSTAGR